MSKIMLTVGELVALAQAGAIARFLATPKPVKVGWENRKIGPMADSELKAYNDKRLELLKDVGATLPEGAREYSFPDGALDKFTAAHEELLAQTVELLGETVPISCMISDALPTDEAVLKAILGDRCTNYIAQAMSKFIKE